MSIGQDVVDKAGGDWGGYGEVDLATLISQGKVFIVLANNGLLIEMQNAAGQWGTYNIKHTDIANF